MLWIRNAIVGAILSLSISYVMVSVNGFYKNVQMEPMQLLREMIVALVLGLVIGALTVLFKIGSWSILKSLSLHFISTLLIVLIAGYIAHWYSWSWNSVVKVLLYFILIYTVIGLFQFLSMKRDVEDVNEWIRKNRNS